MSHGERFGPSHGAATRRGAGVHSARRVVTHLLAAVLAGVVLSPALAHSQRAVTVRADNDAFNFWQYPWARPDEEYTSGVRLTLDYAGTARWAKRLERAVGGCRGTTAPCAAHRWSFGQNIYTAVRPEDVPVAVPGGRPDAGVLWLSSTSRVEREAVLLEAGWTIGATGALSLAEPLQKFFHDLAPHYNRPITWGDEVPTELVVAVAADARRSIRLGGVDVQPHAGGSFGNLLTELRGGVGARVGAPATLPAASSSPSRRPRVWLEGDAAVRAVARNAVIHGALFRPSARVEARPLVTELQGGLRVRWHNLEAAFVAHRTSAEYVTRGVPHVWSTLEATWFRAR